MSSDSEFFSHACCYLGLDKNFKKSSLTTAMKLFKNPSKAPVDIKTHISSGIFLKLCEVQQ